MNLGGMYKNALNKLLKRAEPETEPKINPFNKSFWEKHDDPARYQYDEKFNLTFGPLFTLLEQNGIKIGPVVFDVGGGRRPLSKHLIGKAKNRRTVFTVDYLKPIDHRFKHVDADVNI